MLPDLIEIIPLAKPVRAEITVPGSKSITNRALILAALAEGEVTLQGALWSEDTQIMVECLHRLGFDVKVEDDPAEFCNRTITVKGLGGRIPQTGTPEQPLDLFVGNAGTAARFLAAFVCLGQGTYRLSGVPRMHERPQAALFQALRELGYVVEAAGDKLPAVITGTGPKSGAVASVSIAKSSQFASALLLCAQIGGWKIQVSGENAEESPYVAMTSKLMEKFPKQGGAFLIEPDASSGSYFWAAGAIDSFGDMEKVPCDLFPFGGRGFNFKSKVIRSTTVRNWPDESGWQIDARYPNYNGLVEHFAFALERKSEIRKLSEATWKKYFEKTGHEPGAVKISRQKDLGDSIMTLITLSPQGYFPIVFTDLGRLRVQECERVVALRTELTKCGAKVIEEGDTLTVYPSQLHGAEIETYNDHRMAMCFAVLGLKVPGIKIRNPACVKKTFPNFFQKLAAAPPCGLGAEIWEIKDGQRVRKLAGDDLFAG